MVALDPVREAVGFGLVGVWLGYVGYRLEWYRQPAWVLIVLCMKVLAAWAFGWLYASYYCHGDTLKVYLSASRIAHYLWSRPLAGIALLFREFSSNWEELGWQIFWQDAQLFGYDYEWSEPSNYHFYRLVVPLYLAAGGSYYGFQGLLGIIGGLLSYAAYVRWSRIAAFPNGFWVLWFLWPSGLLWFSGALRDTLVMPLMLYGAAWIASVRSWRDAWGILAVGLAGLLRAEAALLGAAVGLAYRWHKHRWLIGVGAAVAAVVFTIWVGPWAYRYRTEALDPLWHPDVQEASVFRISYTPSPIGVWIGWVQGVFYGLFGPFVWQVRKPIVALYAIEVLFAAVLMGRWGIWVSRRRAWSWRSALLVAIGVAVVGVTAMAMPYWGTLTRQRLYGLVWIAIGLGMAVQEGLQRGQHSPS